MPLSVETASPQGSAASVHFPPSLITYINQNIIDNDTGSGLGIRRVFFPTNALYLRSNELSQTTTVDSGIVIVDVPGVVVTDLEEPVVFTFRKNTV